MTSVEDFDRARPSFREKCHVPKVPSASCQLVLTNWADEVERSCPIQSTELLLFAGSDPSRRFSVVCEVREAHAAGRFVLDSGQLRGVVDEAGKRRF